MAEAHDRQEDLRLLTTIALSAGRKGLTVGQETVFRAWRDAFPDDALGPLGIALCWFNEGRHAEAIALIERDAVTASTRADQAREALEELRSALGESQPPQPGPADVRAGAP